jgi:hypothetical protein
MPANADAIIRLEMGFTPAELHQRLPAIAVVEYNEALAQFDHVEEGRRWNLRLIGPRQRTIGRLRLPVVDVELVFQGYEPSEIASFMALFHAHFRRGGG